MRLAPSYQGTGHFVAWSYTLLRNACFNELRKNKRTDLEEYVENLVDESSESFELQIDSREQFQSVLNQINELPTNQRLAVLMWAVEDLSYEDIAKELDLTESSVKSLLFRAREKLRSSS